MKNRHFKKLNLEERKKIKGVGGLTKKKHKELMISKGISKTFVFQDSKGNYFIPFCTYNHCGAIGKEKLEERNCPSCRYYQVFILDKKYIENPFTCIGLEFNSNYL